MAAQLGDAFALVHELDFGEAKLLALGKILGRFVGQIGLAKRSVNYRVHHSRYLHVSFSLRTKETQSASRSRPGSPLLSKT
jgi:hypothetical protein